MRQGNGMETRSQPTALTTPLGTTAGEGHPNAFKTAPSAASKQLSSLDRPHSHTDEEERARS